MEGEGTERIFNAPGKERRFSHPEAATRLSDSNNDDDDRGAGKLFLVREEWPTEFLFLGFSGIYRDLGDTATNSLISTRLPCNFILFLVVSIHLRRLS